MVEYPPDSAQNRENVRHLTDFKGGTKNIQFHTVSLDQMKPISPAALFTKLRALSGLVFGLLGAALLWSGAVWVQDLRGRKEILRWLMRSGGADSCGFRQLETGEWLWALPPAVVSEEGGRGHLSGPFVTLSSIIGVRRLSLCPLSPTAQNAGRRPALICGLLAWLVSRA